MYCRNKQGLFMDSPMLRHPNRLFYGDNTKEIFASTFPSEKTTHSSTITLYSSSEWRVPVCVRKKGCCDGTDSHVLHRRQKGFILTV